MGDVPATRRPIDLPWLTIARVPAAGGVVLYHTSGFITPHLPAGAVRDAATRFIDQGSMGVVFFFVLSGFILTHVHGGEEDLDRRRFYLARFARIWPVYMISLLACLPLLFQDAASLVEHRGLLSGLLRTAVRTVSVLTFTQAWHPGMALFWNAAAWTLSCEAFFYLLFPWLAPRIRRIPTALLWLAILACMVPMVGRFGLYKIVPNLHLNFNPLVRLPEFVAGICLAVIHQRGFRLGAWAPWPFALLATVAAAVPASGLWNLLAMHVGFLGLVISFASFESPATSAPGRFLVLLGQASFAVYLLHVPFAEFLLPRLPGGLAAWFVYLVVVQAAAIGTYLRIEGPARRWILRRADRKGPVLPR